MSDSVIINVNVLDENEPPSFDRNYSVTVREDAPAFWDVVFVRASDADVGDNGIIDYSITADGDGRFKLSAKLGLIETKTKPLDRETTPEYELVVKATDRGVPPLSDTAHVTVTVLDVNDNTPLFSQSQYEIEIKKGSLSSALVKATDPDAGNNGTIEYIIDFIILDGLKAAAVFSIDASSGDLTFTGDIENPPASRLIFNVIAKDKGVPPKSANAKVTAIFSDINTAPEFNATNYQFTVEENSAVSIKVGKLICKDEDPGQNGLLTYSVDAVLDGADMLAVNNETGELSLKVSPDREKREIHRIRCACADHGEPPLSASAEVLLIVTDVNDNSPEFTDQKYSVTIAADAGIGTKVLNVSATDLDSGTNAQVHFSKSSDSSPGADQYAIDTNGKITVKTTLDPSVAALVSFKVVASDKGQPPKSSEAVVEISVVTNRPPAFNRTKYVFNVAEDSARQTIVGQIFASDPDAGANGQVSYRLADSRSKLTRYFYEQQS